MEPDSGPLLEPKQRKDGTWYAEALQVSFPGPRLDRKRGDHLFAATTSWALVRFLTAALNQLLSLGLQPSPLICADRAETRPCERFAVRDITGETHGRLTAVRREPRPRRSVWLWACTCGIRIVAEVHEVRKGKKVADAGVKRLVGNDGRLFERLAQHVFAIKLPKNIELMWLQSSD
jgi:hypothetical protein